LKAVVFALASGAALLAVSVPTLAEPNAPAASRRALAPPLTSFVLPRTPPPAHDPAPRRRPVHSHPRPAAKPAVRPAPPPRVVHAPPATVSLYERTARRWVLQAQGCSAGRRGIGGIVILDFGKPSYDGRSYGTILFSGRFAGNRRITRAMLSYAVGYAHCLARGSRMRIALARGTSNYHPSVPSAYAAGWKWARETGLLGRMLAVRGLDDRVRSAAADDAEPAWDRGFRRTRDFFRGYRAAGVERTLYNFGSLDGGIGAIWTARQAFYVAGGMRYSRAMPEIYSPAMAREWAELAQVAHSRFHRSVRFAGVMTQHSPGCSCSLAPTRAHATLVRELARRVGPAAPVVPSAATNIRSPG
jgi:hypothetical protein